MTNTRLATFTSYDRDITSTGGDWALYADGRVGVTTRSRWQGSRDGERWIETDALPVDVSPEEAERSLAEYANACEGVDFGCLDEAGMRQIGKGWIVQ